MKIEIPNRFTPRPYQRKAMEYFDSGGKRAVCVWHRRAGKDLVFLHQTAKSMLRRPGAYWHVMPDLAHGRRTIWEGFTKDGDRIMELVFPKAIRRFPLEFLPSSAPVVELVNGSVWRLQGSDKMEVVGAGPVGLVFSEFALARPGTWDLCRPMLLENGGWAAFISTPRGPNHLLELYEMAKANPSWYADLQTIYDTGAVEDPERAMAEERATGMPDDVLEQEYLCSFSAAVAGSIYGALLKEAEGRVSDFDSDPLAGWFTSWDLGLSDATAIWVWRPTGHESFDVVDHYEASGQPLSHYFDWLDSRPWRVRKHFLPHDARATTLASPTSILDQVKEHFGPTHVGIGPELGKLDGIAAGRWLLQRPGLRIHKTRCAAGLLALGAYHRAWDPNKKAYGKMPVHDWSSNCLAGETAVLTRNGTCRMVDLPSTGEVMTPCGWSEFRNPRMQKRSARLVEVTFADGYSVRCTPDHLFLTDSGWRSAESLGPGSRIQSASMPGPNSLTEESTGGGRPASTSGTNRCSTGTCGAQPSVPSPRSATSTTSTGIRPTTNSRISSALMARPTSSSRPPRESEMGLSQGSRDRRDWLPPSGTGARPGELGTLSRPSDPRLGRSGGVGRESASTAERSSPPSSATTGSLRSSAPTTARQPTSESATLGITSVRSLDEVADVWDITVPGVECFALANGAIVHNSSDSWRYLACAARVVAKLLGGEEPKPPSSHLVVAPANTLGDPGEVIRGRRGGERI